MQNNESQEHRQKIHNYLQLLGTYLARLNSDDANEVLREIESHIYDAIDLQEQSGDVADITGILAGLGPPRQLAEQYVSHVTQGTPPPKGFAAIALVKKTVSKGMYWGTGFLGYLLGCALVLLGFLKLIVPHHVGVWSSEQGRNVVVGLVENPMINSNEIFGMWLVPVALILGVLILRFTYSLMLILKQYQRKND